MRVLPRNGVVRATKPRMDERTWQLFTKAALSHDERVVKRKAARREFGSTQPYERVELDGHCSCHPHTQHPVTSNASS